MTLTMLTGDCRDVLATLDAASVQAVITSPPYFGLRDYGVAGQLGLEPLHDCLAWARSEPPCGACYVCALRAVFAQVWRVLRDDGVCFLNLGDSYAGGDSMGRNDAGRNFTGGGGNKLGSGNPGLQGKRKRITGLKPKDLIGIPWRVALALQADGWFLRSDVIWSKPNPMPESVTDRPTRAHEYIFVLTKSARYFWDQESVREPSSRPELIGKKNGHMGTPEKGHAPRPDGWKQSGNQIIYSPERNLRSVWSIATAPYAGAHFATFPPALVERCLLAGTRTGDTVLDPFGGSGTVGRVAIQHNRDCVLIDLNGDYTELQKQRTNGVQVYLEGIV